MSLDELRKKVAKAEQDEAFPLANCFGEFVCNDSLPQDRDYYRWDESENRYVPVACITNCVVDVFRETMDKAPKTGEVRNIELNLGSELRVRDLRSPCVIDLGTRTATPVTGWVFTRNCIVIPKPDGTVVSKPYTRQMFTLGRLPYDYDADATCPTIDAWLEERLGDDDAIRALWEFIGSCLEPGNRHKTFLLFVGEGNTGKSCCMNLIRAILGDENVSSLPAPYLNVPSVTPATRFKLLNISEEKSHLSSSCQEVLKDWVSGGPVLYNPKYRSAFTEPASAKLLFSMNRLPDFTDTSKAIYNRACCIGWDRIIPLDDALPLEEMARRFESELPGALNKALAAKRTLDARGRFMKPAASSVLADELYTQSSPFIAWFVSACECRPNARTLCQDAYDDFMDWCNVAGVRPPPSIIEFGKALRNLGVVGDQRVRITRKRQRTKDANGKERQAWAYQGFSIVHPSMRSALDAGSII